MIDAVARRTDPATSHQAAWSLRDLSAYEAAHGAVAPSTVRTRRRELQDIGAIEVVGRSTTRGGRPCQVFRAAPSTASQA